VSPAPAGSAGATAAITAPVTTTCTVTENGVTRTFRITVDPPAGSAAVAAASPSPASSNGGTPVFSPFQGKTELVEIKVRVGDRVDKGQVVAAVEAMKAKHDVKSPVAGTVASIDAELGADIEAGRSILTIGG
jgi:biotin carboxyl carrier protein